MANSERVLEALRVLQEEGREDLLQEGVLVQEGIGLKRPRRASSEGVAAAVIACSSPGSGKKFRQKSVMGRRYGQAVAEGEEREGVPGSGRALASGRQEKHTSEAGQGRPAFTSGHTVGISTPLRHLQEERVRPGAAYPTSGDSVLSSQVWKRHMTYDEPSASQSAGGLIRDMGFEEALDFDEENETVAMVGGNFKDVGGKGNNQSCSVGVLQGQKRAAVRSDR
ncbi:hypothetical protein NDU88_001274 [Pleurodeles waltl]|uniref:Uncharacterized protein n=1 Tax=Pleurodeles waltl TaxID=8319 RepID=A0AAV7WLA7_PLEWA|nr:hypothetical protein NDU88_001274 [Pleurodeles waltl]